jgi:hypothetical protein
VKLNAKHHLVLVDWRAHLLLSGIAPGRQFHQPAARQELAARPVPPALSGDCFFGGGVMDAEPAHRVILQGVAVEYVGLRSPT